MFKKLKKSKSQVVEIAEKNENLIAETVEKSENISVDSNDIIPDAAEALEESKQKWNSPTPDVILKQIKSECKNGNRYVKFYNSLISDELVKELRNKGYRVEVRKLSSIGPYFEIYW